MYKNPTLARTLIFAPFVALLGACTQDSTAQAQTRQNTVAQVREALGPVPASLDTATAARLSGAFRGAADRALPAVVQISVTTRADRARTGTRNLPFDIPGFPGDGDQAPREGRGTGSGVVFDNRGYILTNNHVVATAATVRVVMVDGREYDAKVIGTDPNTDVAVIKIEPRAGEKLNVAPLGNSDALKVGDWVLALGSPLGLDFTVTAGIVSAKSRNINIIESDKGEALEGFIQTDAAINPGNSGGPLVDLLGRVVGINSAIQSPTGYFAGAGFAIPIDLAKKVAGDLIKYGVVHRPRLGVLVAAVREADAEVYRLPSVAGAQITSVQDGSPAHQAGLKMGDVVVSLNNEPVRTSTDFMVSLAERQPGDEVSLGVIRYGKKVDAKVKLGEFEVAREKTATVASRPNPSDLLGFTARAMTGEVARALRVDPREARGQVIIAEVDPMGPAYRNVPGGQEIVSINGTPINSVSDVDRVASRLKPGDTVSIITKGPLGNQISNYRTRG